ncbi:MAG: metallophosphoesterase [Muribaculaceae bacterium]|nr:metallophosphoesterase [Muribaculaceae bacterium]
MKLLLLHISDIHVGTIEKTENEGLVLKKFVLDVEEQIGKFQYDRVFVLISGDLVFSSSDESYKKFDELIVQPLMKILNIERNHFIITPGNHDVVQSHIKDVEDSFLPIIANKYGEDKFNDVIRKEAQKGIIFDKFKPFHRYLMENMAQKEYSLMTNQYSLNNIWSVHTVNSAVFSCGGYNKIDDNGNLGIDTRGLYKLLQEDDHPKKILLMHHPEYFCLDWVKHELRKLYGNGYDIILTGHTHDQFTYCNEDESYIHCEAPQLYTNKFDLTLGYSFIEIENDYINKIVYRQWQEKRNKFRPGSDFVEDEESNGIINLKHRRVLNQETDSVDTIDLLLKERLRNEMESYIGQPNIWIDRYLSNDRIDNVFKINESTLFSENDIINNKENLHIIAPSQYGLTCYGSHFLLTLWETKKEFGIKINAENIRLKKFEKLIDAELQKFSKNKSDVSWIIIDNWRPYKKDQKGIKLYLETEFPTSNIILMTTFHEREFIEEEITKEELIETKTLYLTPLKRSQERLLVDAYNKEKFIDDSEEVLNKLDEDIKNFNLHRTPYSCVTLLTVFKDSFDRNPVNRTDVLENILNIIFDNTNLPNYRSNKPDAKDCNFCLGYFCAQMLEKKFFFFSREDFINNLKDFCEQKEYDVDLNQLFDILFFNKIIIEDQGYYKFHFTFWVYFFVASWMNVDEEYSKFILKDQHYIHYPEILEFYTGKDRRRKDAVEILTKDISNTSHSIMKQIGLKEEDDPYSFLRYKQDDEKTNLILEKIETDVRHSNLPQSVKDSAVDLSFNPSAAFHQEIFKVYSDFSVGYLINIIRIGSKVLRNSDQLDASIKQELLSELTSAMKVLSNIIYLVSPLFAKQGYIQLTEYSFQLEESFLDLDEKDRTIGILVTIPYNLTMLFKEDIFSSKLSPVYISALKKEKDKVKRHLLASLLIYKQPDGWDNAIMSYMESIGHNSYYLGTLLELMLTVYKNCELEGTDRQRMKNLIKTAMYKNDKGRLPNALGEYKDIPLPKELNKNKEETQTGDKNKI